MAPVKACYTVPLCGWRQSKEGFFCHFSENILCVNLSNIVGQEEKDGNGDLKKKKKIMLFIKHVIQM